ncbi:hypothetical protein F0225_05170 [Vibrio pectenicida]|uniref:Glutamine amidotransferase n=1 Tax=Vibrio pectenicida TaxID=62763 RepID=A0A7Y3ZXH0_9VIBR|nr:gamma-glutamyl-gamma-aminobutyrate hydrolase family protein [Vibrio pectenicida]NOH70737.1 hypothetical protein [Vibrio pectenicida]
MKNIAITQRLILHDDYEEMRETLDINYAKLIKESGFLPVIIPYEVDFIEYVISIGIDGVLFTGGNDLFICNGSKLSKKRDDFEKEILKYCIDNGIPIMGVCRGMQLIASYFGSSFKRIDSHVNVRNKLCVNNQSRYYSYLKEFDNVNSYHNFSISKLADDFLISAKSDDNIIKAIEHNEYKIFGQMWHSEREVPFNSNDISFINAFFKK